MKKRILTTVSIFLSILIILSTGCVTGESKPLNKANLNIYYTQSQLLIQKGKYSDLKKLSEKILARNSDEYQAAYNRAFAMEMMDEDGLTYYIDFVNKMSTIPEFYKVKWIDLASLKRKEIVKVDLPEIIIDILTLPSIEGKKSLNRAQIIATDKFYFFLDRSGALYQIDRLSKALKKINYSETGSFISFNSYLVFNDSVNLIRYNPVSEEYLLLSTLETNKISFLKQNVTRNNGIVGYNFDNQDYVIYINFDSGVIKKLPDNSVDHSFDLRTLAIRRENLYELFNLEGEKVFEVKDDFLSFTRKGGLLVKKDGYLTIYDIGSGHSKRLLYLPAGKEPIKVHPLSSRIVIEMPGKILITDYEGSEVKVYDGNLINIFSEGLFLKNPEDSLLYLNFKGKKENLCELPLALEELIYSGINSTLFALRKGDKIELYDLSHLRED